VLTKLNGIAKVDKRLQFTRLGPRHVRRIYELRLLGIDLQVGSKTKLVLYISN